MRSVGRSRRSRLVALVAGVAAAVGAFAAPRPASAVLLYKTATRNWQAPTGMKTNSGWQWFGKFGGFAGTPIARNYFITASHIGGGVGTPLVLNGKSYQTTAVFDDPATDLRIFKVSTPFSSWAPLYTGSSEVGKWTVDYGRGTQRGSAVTKNNQTKGWKWGTDDRIRSWGENYVAGTVDGGSGFGQLLRYTFSSDGKLASEGALSNGDSGGPAFVRDSDGKWKLAGINYLVEGPFSTTGTNGSGFSASIFDKGGLYVGGDNAWKFTADTAGNVPAAWYATRISSRQAWIKSIVGSTSASSVQTLTAVSAVPEPASIGTILAVGGVALLRRKRRA